MIELSIYLWTVGILSTIILAFVIQALREKSFKTKASDSENEKTKIANENSELKDKLFQKESSLVELRGRELRGRCQYKQLM